MTTVLLDTHVLHWWASEPERVSADATLAITAAAELAVADITWFELAWLATHGRISLSIPLSTWLRRLAADVRTIPVTPSIASTAVDLPASFPSDPADRLIYATAIDQGWRLITKDERLHAYPSPHPVTLW